MLDKTLQEREGATKKKKDQPTTDNKKVQFQKQKTKITERVRSVIR